MLIYVNHKAIYVLHRNIFSYLSFVSKYQQNSLKFKIFIKYFKLFAIKKSNKWFKYVSYMLINVNPKEIYVLNRNIFSYLSFISKYQQNSLKFKAFINYFKFFAIKKLNKWFLYNLYMLH